MSTVRDYDDNQMDFRFTQDPVGVSCPSSRHSTNGSSQHC